MDFESCAKLWPHQLDLLSGPLLEDDDDIDNQISKEFMLNTNNLSGNPTREDCLDNFEPDVLCDETHDKFSSTKTAVRRIYVSNKNPFSPVKTSLGMVVYVGRKHDTHPDSDEEVDIESVDEQMNSVVKKSSLSYHAFSRQVLDVLEDKEILHEVPNVIFATEMDKDASLSHTACESTANLEEKCDATVLQASDVDSLLEQFEASEGVTSQEPMKQLLSSFSDCVVPVDNVKCSSTVTKKKDVSPYIIQKIKMSSAVKKGPILIPPSHQPKLKSRNNSQNGALEARKSGRSSTSSFCNKESAALSKMVQYPKYSFTLDHDHDYCSSSHLCPAEKLGSGSEKVWSIKGNEKLEHVKSTNSDLNSAEHVWCRTVNNTFLKKPEEESFVPDAEIEVEVVESHVETSSKVASSISTTHNEMSSKSDIPDSVAMEKDRHTDSSQGTTQPSFNSIQIKSSLNLEEAVPQSLEKLCLQSEYLVLPTNSVTGSAIRVSDRTGKVENGYCMHYSNSSNCNLLKGKHKHENDCPGSSNISQSKKFCGLPKLDTCNSHQTLGEEKTDVTLWKRTRRPCVDNNGRPFWKSEKQKQIEERRVVYVGKLTEGMKVNDLRECFVRFGPIQDISIHFRESGDNYGFVTFFNRSDAYEVVERGKLDPALRKFDLCFGGRRQFCRTRYADLDSVDEDPLNRSLGGSDFDTLLQKAKAGSQSVGPHVTLS